METPNNEIREARVKSAEEAVRQALDQLAKAETDDEVEVLANRLKQRKTDLRRIKESEPQLEEVAA